MLSIRKSILAALALTLALAVPAFGADAPAVEKYLPDDADGLISINVRAFLDSALVKKAGLDKLLAGDEDTQKSLKALGLDPFKDIDRVLISGGKKDDDNVIVIQGKFDPAKLHAAAEAAAKEKSDVIKVHKAEHGKIYEITKLDEIIKLPAAAGAAAGSVPKEAYAVVADKGNIVITSTKEGAEVVLAKAAGKKTTKLASKETAELIKKVDPKQTIAVAIPAPGGEEKIKSITGGVTVAKDVKVDIKVAAADADAAKALGDQIKEGLDMVQALVGAVALQQKELAPLVDVLNAITHEAKDSDVNITADIKGETLEKLFNAVAELIKQQGAIK